MLWLRIHNSEIDWNTKEVKMKRCLLICRQKCKNINKEKKREKTKRKEERDSKSKKDRINIAILVPKEFY